MARRAGLIVPLFSAWSTSGWGIGELPDLAPLSAWMQTAGFRRLMLLPLGTMAEGQASPYSAASAMAIDPIYIALDRLGDFQRAGGIEALSPAGRQALAEARAGWRVRHDAVRRAKREALILAASRFLAEEWEAAHVRAPPRLPATSPASAGGSTTTRSSRRSRDRCRTRAGATGQRSCAIASRARSTRRGATWRGRPRAAVLAMDCRRAVAGRARGRPPTHGVDLLGRPALSSSARTALTCGRGPGIFILDVSAGAPPDAFSAEGQDWGLPAYRWDAIAASASRGCGSARAAWPRSTTAFAWTISSASIAPTGSRRRGAVFHAGR